MHQGREDCDIAAAAQWILHAGQTVFQQVMVPPEDLFNLRDGGAEHCKVTPEPLVDLKAWPA